MADTNLIERGGIYYARLWIRGREIRRSLRTGDRRIARRRLKELREQAERALVGLPPKEAPKRWQDAVLRFTELHLPGLRPATADRYQVSLRQLDGALRGVLLSEISQSRLSAYAARRMKDGTSPATVRRDLTTASLVLSVARRAGWVTANPAREELGSIKERREVIRPVRMRDLARARRQTLAEGHAFREGKASLHALLGFLVRTGCRLEEAASLETAELSLTEATATFVKTKTRSPRTIDLPPQVVRELKTLDRPKGCTYVFHHGGKRYSQPGSLLAGLVSRGAREGAGTNSPVSARPFRIHDLRHTHAIRQLSWPLPKGRKKLPAWRRRMSIYDLAERLGHRQVSTTEGYARWLKGRRDGWMGST